MLTQSHVESRNLCFFSYMMHYTSWTTKLLKSILVAHWGNRREPLFSRRFPWYEVPAITASWTGGEHKPYECLILQGTLTLTDWKASAKLYEVSGHYLLDRFERNLTTSKNFFSISHFSFYTCAESHQHSNWYGHWCLLMVCGNV